MTEEPFYQSFSPAAEADPPAGRLQGTPGCQYPGQRPCREHPGQQPHGPLRRRRREERRFASDLGLHLSAALLLRGLRLAPPRLRLPGLFPAASWAVERGEAPPESHWGPPSCGELGDKGTPRRDIFVERRGGDVRFQGFLNELLR